MDPLVHLLPSGEATYTDFLSREFVGALEEVLLVQSLDMLIRKILVD